MMGTSRSSLVKLMQGGCSVALQAAVPGSPPCCLGILGHFTTHPAQYHYHYHCVSHTLSTILTTCLSFPARSWSNGKVLFASGSPFAPITDTAGVMHHPAQANNAYIFPAVGYAAILAHSREITNEMFVLAAEELSKMTDMEELEQGRSAAGAGRRVSSKCVCVCLCAYN